MNRHHSETRSLNLHSKGKSCQEMGPRGTGDFGCECRSLELLDRNPLPPRSCQLGLCSFSCSHAQSRERPWLHLEFRQPRGLSRLGPSLKVRGRTERFFSGPTLNPSVMHSHAIKMNRHNSGKSEGETSLSYIAVRDVNWFQLSRKPFRYCGSISKKYS